MLLVARAGFARTVPVRVDSVPVATIAALIELGIDPRAFCDLRRHDSRLVDWSGDGPVALKSPETVHVERGALEATLFARVLRHPRLTLAPAPVGRAELRSMIDVHAQNGAVVIDATGRAAVLAAQRVTTPSPWYAWTTLWPVGPGGPLDESLRIAAVSDGYCYRLGTRHRLSIGLVRFSRGRPSPGSDRLEAYRREVPWFFEGIPGPEACSATRVHCASVQWASHVGTVAVGDASLSRDALSSQGLASAISQAHYAVAVDSRADVELYQARSREQRRGHLRSLDGMLSESRHAGVAPWLRYRQFVARELEVLSTIQDPVVVLRSRQLSAVPTLPIGS